MNKKKRKGNEAVNGRIVELFGSRVEETSREKILEVAIALSKNKHRDNVDDKILNYCCSVLGSALLAEFAPTHGGCREFSSR